MAMATARRDDGGVTETVRPICPSQFGLLLRAAATTMPTGLQAMNGIKFFPLLFRTYVDDGMDDVPIRKEIADALTEEIIRLRGGRNRSKGGSRWVIEDRSNALVQLSKEEGSSVGRRRKYSMLLDTILSYGSSFHGTQNR